MSRPSRLIFTHKRTEHEASQENFVIAEFEDGIPLGWLFCFGGRNFWAPDDKVADRGGTAADRNRFETPLEVADARLGNACDALESHIHLWVWLKPLELLHRRIQARGKSGFLRLDANWAFSGKKQAEMNAIPAFAENYIHGASTENVVLLRRAADALKSVAPFVPEWEVKDRRQFEKSRAAASKSGHRRAAALVVGHPAREEDIFFQRLDEVYAPVFEQITDLPEYPLAPTTTASVSKSGKTDAGFFSRFLRRGGGG